MSSHTHRMEYAGRLDTRAVWRCVGSECDFTYSRQLTAEQLEELDAPSEEPAVELPGDGNRAGDEEG